MINEMSYREWCEVFGIYRWYHKDGNPRTYYPLDYNWKAIYDGVTRDTDIYFDNYWISNVSAFTDEFLSLVPITWQKYKVKFEMLTGTLDGTNIDPKVFEAGFDRTTETESNRKYDSTNKNKVTDNDTNILGSRVDNVTEGRYTDTKNKGRGINYSQGVQAYDGQVTENNIGDLGLDFADSMSEQLSKGREETAGDTTSTTGAQTNTATGETKGDSETNMNTSAKYKETISERRINFYDNLAFLRERMEQLKSIEPFHYSFKHLFRDVYAINEWF